MSVPADFAMRHLARARQRWDESLDFFLSDFEEEDDDLSLDLSVFPFEPEVELPDEATFPDEYRRLSSRVVSA